MQSFIQATLLISSISLLRVQAANHFQPLQKSTEQSATENWPTDQPANFQPLQKSTEQFATRNWPTHQPANPRPPQ
ncbi:hypothetical protein [Nostoc sp.]|uniref:hypothetical protein n=1 Tax=Nostoc sp. TaxID=1180 RepID=UPI002FF9C9C4